MNKLVSQIALIVALSVFAKSEEVLMGLTTIGGVTYESFFDADQIREANEEKPARLSLNEAAKTCLEKLARDLPELRDFKPISLNELRYEEGAVYLVILERAPIRRFGEHKKPLENVYVYCSIDGKVFVPRRKGEKENAKQDTGGKREQRL